MTSPSSSDQAKTYSPLAAGAISVFIPGLGQFFARKRYRGVAVLLAFIVSVLIVLWYQDPLWIAAPVVIWLWNIWDAMSLAVGKARSILLPILAILLMSYIIGWQVTKMDLTALTENIDRARSVLVPMLHPDFVTNNQVTDYFSAPVEVPCGPNPPISSSTENGVMVEISPNCGKLLDKLTVHATGLLPNTQELLQWQTVIGDKLPLGKGFSTPLYVTTDANGTLNVEIHIPSSALNAAPDPTKPLLHSVLITQTQVKPGIKLSANGAFILNGIYQTIFMGLMATFLGALGAIPFSFLAARNLMGGNPITLFIYVVIRTILNLIRSIEPLIFAIIFVVIVGLGPFPGVIAMTLHTIASLGKLYSEVIEGIDEGQIEAIRATGGNWLQIVRYAVIPQIIPPFFSFTLFRWDINVRSSTIIGLVGGGGIGFYIYQWIFKGDYRALGAAFISIAIIVIALDYLSARVRARLV